MFSQLSLANRKVKFDTVKSIQVFYQLSTYRSWEMTYIFLALAIVFEVLGTFFIKQSQGFTRIVPSLIMFLYYGLSFSSLTLAAKKMDVSVAYPVWTGSAIALVTLMGIIYFKEPSSELKLISIALISFGVLGLAFGHKT